MSLYGAYIAERLGDGIYETPEGFATYRFPTPDTCYIVDLYVIPEARKRRVASDIAAHIEGIAKMRGCKKLIGSVVPSAKGSTESIHALLRYGMRLDSSAIDFILFSKEIA